MLGGNGVGTWKGRDGWIMFTVSWGMVGYTDVYSFVQDNNYNEEVRMSYGSLTDTTLIIHLKIIFKSRYDDWFLCVVLPSIHKSD